MIPATASASQAHEARDLLERELLHEAGRAVRSLLAEVERAALVELDSYRTHGGASGSLTAAGLPRSAKLTIGALSAAAVGAAWTSVVVPRIRERLAEPDLALGESYLTQAQERLAQSNLPDRLAESAAEILAKGSQEHWPKDRFARELSAALASAEWAGSVERVVRIEATTGFNSSVLTTLARERIPSKRWVTERDERVRSSHRHVEGQVRKLSSPFLVGGYALMMPGDPSAPLSETAGCRCVIVGARERS